jgi:magnesium-transporting ATPase (P-type)
MENSSKGASDIRRLASCPLDQLYVDLGTGPKGVSTADADRKLNEIGLNILPETRKLSLIRKTIVQFKNLFNVLLMVAAILSFFTGWTSNDMGSIQMGFAILLVVIVSVLFSLFQEHRAERAIDALRKLVPDNIKVLRDGKVTQESASRVVPGDIIALEEGDKVPADARLISAFQLSIDNSMLTGESEPQPRQSTCDDPEDCVAEDRTNLVFAGTTVASGSGTAVVLMTGSKTRFGQVVGIAHEIEEPLSPLQKEINYTARLNFIAAIAISLLFLVITWQFLHLRFSESVLFMIGVMVCLVPEGLQVTLTLSLALSSLAMSKNNVVIKRLSSVETLGSTTVICTDKTGTITEGQMTVRNIWMSGDVFDVTGEGYEPDGEIFLKGQELVTSDRKDLHALCYVAALDNKATLVPPLDRRKYRWTAVGDSTDAALLVLAAKSGLDPRKTLEEQPRIGMIDFDSKRKIMTSVHQSKDGVVTAYVKGAGNEVLSRCGTALWADKIVPMTPELADKIRARTDDFARGAYRVIALATRTLPEKVEKFESDSVETNLTFVGLVAILDPPRRDVAQAVRKARNAGIKIVMLTGDHQLTAAAIARKVGIITSTDSSVISCERLADRTDEELSGILDSPELVFARVTPEQKLRIVRILKEKGETVAVTGDGVNDAPALLEADIGIAMGITGTDVARESADMVLLDDNFASIVGGVEIGRSVFDNLKKFIVYVFGHNWAELLTFIVFVLLQTPLPLAVVGVLAIDLLLEIPPSISLTMEPPEPGIMDRQPRSRSSRLFDVTTLARSCYIGTLIGIAAVFWCFVAWSEGGWSLGQSAISDKAVYMKGTTVVLVGIMAGQLGNLFATRTNIKSTFTLSLTRNRWLLPSIAAELMILAAIVYVPFVQLVFGTAALQPIEWLYLFSFAPVILLLEEARKLYVRRVLLPAPAVAIPAPVPLASHERAEAIPFKGMRRRPFVEVGPPVIVMSFSETGTETALPIAMRLAEQTSSKILIASDRELPRSRQTQISAESGVPFEYIRLDIADGSKGKRSAAKAIRKYADRIGAEMIVVPVKRDVFGDRTAQKMVGWIEELLGKQVVLVSGPSKPSRAQEHPRRLLIPVLDEFHPEVFALAGALTSASHIPDVDVVAARVIRMPPTVPLYSTFRPESLVDSDGELSFLKALSGLPLLRRLSSRVLLVRDTAKDLVSFADERRVDLIVLKGDWAASRHGFLAKTERRIAAKASSYVAVLLSSGR